MKPAFKCLLCVLFSLQLLAGVVLQDFECGDKTSLSSDFGTSVNASCALSAGEEPVYSGRHSWKTESKEQWNITEIRIKPLPLSFSAASDDRFIFRIYALPSNKAPNNVALRFYDDNLYAARGFEVWTHRTAEPEKWTTLSVLFSELPRDFKIDAVKKIQFTQYWPGTYYLDDIQRIREDRIYQAFEPERCVKPDAGEYGWVWNKKDWCGFSSAMEPVYEGLHSWKIVTRGNWGGTGIQSEQQACIKANGNLQQTRWNADFEPEVNDRLIFRVYALPQVRQDVNLALQVFDNELHFEDENKVEIWTSKKARYGEWTEFSILFSQFPKTLNLRDIHKLQFLVYYPGTYYFDGIMACGPVPELHFTPSDSSLEWSPNPRGRGEGLDWYQLEGSSDGKEWRRVYRGNRNVWVPDKDLKNALFRVRYETLGGLKEGVSYYSQWSPVFKFSVSEKV